MYEYRLHLIASHPNNMLNFSTSFLISQLMESVSQHDAQWPALPQGLAQTIMHSRCATIFHICEIKDSKTISISTQPPRRIYVCILVEPSALCVSSSLSVYSCYSLLCAFSWPLLILKFDYSVIKLLSA